MAQQASPKVTGQTEDLRAQLNDEAAGEVEEPFGHALEEGRVLVALGALLAVLLPLLQVLELGPDRRRHLRLRRLDVHSRIPSCKRRDF
jgi:hypothetical protein